MIARKAARGPATNASAGRWRANANPPADARERLLAGDALPTKFDRIPLSNGCRLGAIIFAPVEHEVADEAADAITSTLGGFGGGVGGWLSPYIGVPPTTYPPEGGPTPTGGNPTGRPGASVLRDHQPLAGRPWQVVR